jgi:uncharacterized membrane protein YqjE
VTDQTTDDRDRATEPLQPEKSLGDLFGELTTDLSQLFRQEVELAKTEAREEISRAGKGVGMLAGAALGAWLALVMLSLAIAWWLDKGLDRGLAFLLVALVWAVVAIVLALTGKRQAASVRPLPQTVQTLKEDAQWVKAQTS